MSKGTVPAVGRNILVILCILFLLISSVLANTGSSYAGSGTEGTVSLAEQGLRGTEWNQNTGDVKIPFACRKGTYSIVFKYTPDTEVETGIMLSVKIDGDHPSDRFSMICLPQLWVSASDNYFDRNGIEYAGLLSQKTETMCEPARDRDGLMSEDLTVDLAEGEHTLEVGYISGGMKLEDIMLVPAKPLKKYEEYLSENRITDYEGPDIFVEGEAVSSRSSRDIPCYSHNDAGMSPEGDGKKRINAFGGSYWYEANSSGTWEFDVPEDGMYKLSMRVLQNNEGLISQRQILIDGEIPFEEFEGYSFPYSPKFRTEQMGGDNPYLIYLAEGRHSITLRATASAFAEPVRQFNADANALSLAVSEVQMITGNIPDPNFDYELDAKCPETISQIRELADSIEKTSSMVDSICIDPPAMTSNLHADAETIADLANDVSRIPGELGTLTTINGDLRDAAGSLMAQPLGIDWIALQSPSAVLREPVVSNSARLRLALRDFFGSFRHSDEDEDGGKDAIEIWVARDREWANVLEMLIRKEFEPESGINVRLNVLPSGNTTVVNGASPLLLSVVADKTPDIALGCDSRTPIELAIRGELAALDELKGFDEISERFPEGAVKGLSYDGHCYGLPETADIPVLVYRKDVFTQNDIEVPRTWDELMQETMPKLAQIDANFYMGSSSPDMYAAMLYQMGGDIYDEEGNCALDSPEAALAFKQWTRMFVQYDVPQAANFYNEMRTGKLPAGICLLSEYMQLKSYARELTGEIEIAPIPGYVDAKGNIRHDTAGAMTSAVVFGCAEDQEACLEFLDWWLSESVQTRFAREVEMRAGASGRWMTANLEAIAGLSWSQSEREVIESISPDFRIFYNTLGGYYSPRAVTNAWTRTVFSGMDPRDSIEQGYEEIQTQIDRKKREYEK